jgi:hypothetical protein
MAPSVGAVINVIERFVVVSHLSPQIPSAIFSRELYPTILEQTVRLSRQRFHPKIGRAILPKSRTSSGHPFCGRVVTL